MHIYTRATVDMGGKDVDVIPVPSLIFGVFFTHRRKLEDELRLATIEAFRRIAASSNRRVRERDFVVWFGNVTNRIGMDLAVLGLPERVAVAVAECFYETAPAYTELGTYAWRDCNAVPYFRYDHGTIIEYGSPAAPKTNSEGDIVVRGFELLERPRRFRSSTPIASFPSVRARSLHSIDTWLTNYQQIIQWIYDLEGAVSFAGLRKVCSEYFGLGVFLEPNPQIVRLGSLRTGVTTPRGECEVRILVASSLPAELKRVVLAHELAHYALHFPLVFGAQLVEEMSWDIPELGPLYRHILVTHFPGKLFDLEDDADRLAAYCLIPPMYFPLQRMASVMLEMGRQPTGAELAWRFLQPLFPESGLTTYSWRNWDEMISRANREMILARDLSLADADDLYIRMLLATLANESSDTGRDQIVECVGECWNDLMTLLSSFEEASVQEARAALKERLARVRGDSDVQPLSEFGNRREVLPPLSNIERMFPVLPLVPAKTNRAGKRQGMWNQLNESHPSQSLNEWRAAQPNHGLVLYLPQTWQIRRH